MITVKRLTEQDKATIIAEHPEAHPLDYAVYDGGMVYSYYDTEKLAQADASYLSDSDAIADKFQGWLDDVLSEGYDYEQIKEVVASQVS